MEKCERPSCNHVVGENKVVIEGKTYCCEFCAHHCTDEHCECDCATA